jgi:transcriptional regulator with XRE-family HTH domain
MEMKINADRIIAERKVRAWSQQHLADVSAVSMRTIQRVENNASGSLETVKALASCFELDVALLFEPLVVIEPLVVNEPQAVIEPERSKKSKFKSKTAALCLFVLALMSSIFFIVPTSMAANVTVSAEEITTNTDENYSVYSNNVEIFIPKEVSYEVSIDSNWEIKNLSISTGSVKVYLERSVIFIDKALITKMENGTKITTDYAKFSKRK